jgi:hypothetical protein
VPQNTRFWGIFHEGFKWDSPLRSIVESRPPIRVVLDRSAIFGPSPKKAGYKVVGVWKETASGAKNDRAQRKEILALAQAREIDVILVTELTRWDARASPCVRPRRKAVLVYTLCVQPERQGIITERARTLACIKFRFVSCSP